MHCFASENQIYTGTVIFGVESLKPTAEKSATENSRCKRPIFVMGKMSFERTLTLRKFSISCHQI